MRIMKFALVGGVGFIIDAAIFTLLFKGLLLPLMAARVTAFVLAATSTWVGNRWLTFSDTLDVTMSPFLQWLKFMCSACLSAIPNLVTFTIVTSYFGHASDITLYSALVLGVLVGMVSNFTLSRYWVFRVSTESS